MIRPLPLLLAALLPAAALGAPSPGAASLKGLAPGEAVYVRWCAACHAPGPEQPGTGALAAKYQGQLPAALIERTDLEPGLIRTVVRNGITVMPRFRKTEIADAELDQLAAYLTSKHR